MEKFSIIGKIISHCQITKKLREDVHGGDSGRIRSLAG